MPKKLDIFGLDVEARPGPWGGQDFTFKKLLSLAGGYEGPFKHRLNQKIDYIGPGFSPEQLDRFLWPIRQPGTIVVAHNGNYDLGLINGTLIKHGLPALPDVLLSDTYAHLPKLGYAWSKSLRNMAVRFGVSRKLEMTEPDWEAVYDSELQYPYANTEALRQLREYNMGDVTTVLALRRKLIELGILGPPRIWRPRIR